MIGEKEQLEGRAVITTKPNNIDASNEIPKWKLFISFITRIFIRSKKGVINHFEGEADRRRNEANKHKVESEKFAQEIVESATRIESQKLANLETDFKLIDAIKNEKDPKIAKLKLKLLLKERPQINELFNELENEYSLMKSVHFTNLSVRLTQETADFGTGPTLAYIENLLLTLKSNWVIKHKNKNVINDQYNWNYLILDFSNKELNTTGTKLIEEANLTRGLLKFILYNKVYFRIIIQNINKETMDFLMLNQIDNFLMLVSVNLESLKTTLNMTKNTHDNLYKILNDHNLQFELDLSRLTFLV